MYLSISIILTHLGNNLLTIDRMADLPERVDCVFFGTGLINSILAAACARVGKSVLHLDHNDYYGDQWASFTFEQLIRWTEYQQQEDATDQPNFTTNTTGTDNHRQTTFCMKRTAKRDPIFSNVNVVHHHADEQPADQKPSREPGLEPAEQEPIQEPTQEPANREPSREPDQEPAAQEPNRDPGQDPASREPSQEQGQELAAVEDKWTVERLIERSKLFCLDLTPRLIYSNGTMVELLVKSNVARYHEFKNIVRLVSLIDGKFQVLPCKRNEVFSSQIITNLIDKRRLMKFLELCINFNQDQPEQSELNDYFQMDIEKCLIKRDLTKNLRHILINSIGMVDPNTSTLTTCLNIKKFLSSVERFGKSPFLFPMYGCGEFPQSFCRMCAVFGGVYCLDRQAETIQITTDCEKGDSLDDRIIVKLDENRIVKCAKVVLNYSYALSAKVLTSASKFAESRAILITTRSFHADNQDEQQAIIFSRFAADTMSNKYTISLLEVNSTVMVCPTGLSIVYLWTRSHECNATKDLMPIVDKLYNDKGDSVLWSCYYNQLTQHDVINIPDQHKSGLYVTSLGTSDTDYDSAIDEAKNLFQKMFPGEEFLPRAPDPDEIVFDAE